jgi:GNAT superfamily N-acetyltransferase
LASASDPLCELNEVGWWANWADVRWMKSDAYAIFSDDFREYFFNRGGFIRVRKTVERSIISMEVKFASRGLIPHIFIQEMEKRPKLMDFLVLRGYREADHMSIMEAKRRPKILNPLVKVKRVGHGETRQWAEAYLDSFYGERGLLPVVLNCVERAKARGAVTLLLATLEGKIAGELAIFRSPSVCGVYCVGTHPRFRKNGVASTMMKKAYDIAIDEDRRLILQTIVSDSTEQLYLRLGFVRSYLKTLMIKDVGA